MNWNRLFTNICDRVERPSFITGTVFLMLALFVFFVTGYLVVTKQFDKNQLYDMLKLMVGIIIGALGSRYGAK